MFNGHYIFIFITKTIKTYDLRVLNLRQSFLNLNILLYQYVMRKYPKNAFEYFTTKQ